MKRSTKIALGGKDYRALHHAYVHDRLFPLPPMPFLPWPASFWWPWWGIRVPQALIVYVAVSILSIFMTPDREAAIMFICFFGHYPIIKGIIERRFPIGFWRGGKTADL